MNTRQLNFGILNQNLFMANLFSAHCLQLPDGRLEQNAVSYGEFSGQTHLAKPGNPSGVKVAGVPVLHPADHDAPSIGCEDRLWGIEVDAVIHSVIGFLCKDAGVIAAVAQKIEGSVSVVVFKPLRQHVLGTCQQDIVSVETEEVGALPHEADTVVVFRQRTDKCPVNGILAPILQDLPALTEVVVGNQGTERAVGKLQHLRIAEIKTAAACREICLRQNGISFVFLIVQSVSKGETLCLNFADLPVGHGFMSDTGVHEHLPPVGEFNRTAGEAAVLVVRHIGSQRTGKKVPVQQIAAHGVAPVHRSPMRIIGVILKEHVVLSLIPGKAVRIVHPADPRRKVKERAIPVGDGGAEAFFIASCVL